MNRHADDDKKLFVGGLSWQTTNETLKAYFSKFGEVVDAKVMMNRMTDRSRGFGFVTYKDEACVELVLSKTHHELDGKTIDPKGCNQHSANLNQKIKTSPKVFAGGIPFTVTKDEMRNFFQQYGTVLDVTLMMGKDGDPTRHRGFGFVTFESQETVDRLLSLHYVVIDGRQVEIKKAEPQSSRSGGKWGSQDGGQWQQWGPPQGGWQQGPWQQGQWGGQGGWDPQWHGYGPNYGYGYDPNWQQAQGPPSGQWGAQGDASQAPPGGTAPPTSGYPPQQSSNGYGQQAYSGYGQYSQPPAASGAPPAAPAAPAAPATAPAAPYGNYDSSSAAAQPAAAPAAGYPPQPAAPAAAGYTQPAAPTYGADAAQQGYNRQQPAYHPYKR